MDGNKLHALETFRDRGNKGLKILHTSDWHLGRTLYGKKRYHEFEAFLNWLIETINHEQVDVLLVAGDIFDTSTPTNRAQQLYYQFLCHVANSTCRHVVIIGGNHDSPSFLDAPRELLKALNVHVIGSPAEDIGDEVIILHDQQGYPELLVCAVPYLRDRYIRVAEAGESIEDKERKLIEGIICHYRQVAELAEKRRSKITSDIPIIAMGHLFTAGGKTVEGDGVRDLYVGSLVRVDTGMFPENFDYIALGHLHLPQKVNGSGLIRYSGSPLAMGFGEARQRKSILIVEFQGSRASVRPVEIPVFQRLERIEGDWDTISSEINRLSSTGSRAWLEIIYEGKEIAGDLRERIDALLEGTGMEVLRVKNSSMTERLLNQTLDEETLDSLDAYDVFERCLEAYEVPEEQRTELMNAYREVVTSLYEDDTEEE